MLLCGSLTHVGENRERSHVFNEEGFPCDQSLQDDHSERTWINRVASDIVSQALLPDTGAQVHDERVLHLRRAQLASSTSCQKSLLACDFPRYFLLTCSQRVPFQ